MPEAENKIAPFNTFGVGVLGDDIVIVALRARMSRVDALLLAAWLVALSEENAGEFARVLAAVEST